MQKIDARGIALFLYIWLMVGFVTGTVVLLGPAAWLTGWMRTSGASPGAENAAMIAVIVLYVAASFALAFWLVGRMRRSDRRWVRTGAPLAATVLAGLALWGWTNPARYASDAAFAHDEVTLVNSASFAFGPYPDHARLAELKQQGFTAVISLQHPAVLPFEPPGIKAEQEAARDVGITFIHAPMVPWVSDNQAALEQIRALAESGGGRYYVHCGLGRDRTNVVKRMLENIGARMDAQAKDLPRPRTYAQRLADGKPPFERGQIREIEPDVWLIPYPNEHEMYGNMLAGQVAHVLMLLDPAVPQQAQWLAQARRVFTQHAVPFSERPLPAGQTAERASQIVEHARTLPRPLTVIVPFTRPKGDSTVATAFMRAYGVDPHDYPPPNTETDHQP